MTREQAELIIEEEKLIYVTWRDYDYTAGEYHFTIWFNPNNNKYEAVYIGERGGVEFEYSFDSEKEAIDKMLQMNYKRKKYNGKDIKEYLTKEVALRIIKEEKLEVIWYDEALKPLCAGIKHDKQRDKYISFITNAKAKIIEWKSIEFDGDEEFEGEIYNDEDIALYALINRARMIKQNRISFV
ncbi:hypothetical protein EIL92_08985 [Campylobacter jejuni]|uniref:Uncharacterized protein n=5 Tax=Campylobacteraceae TaxID=72294 RepID=A0A3X8NI55_CAMJU|nr:hypothetical protein [Campylobacter jejuni]EAB5249672.1 hypothetical protein [Campylobacter jejuni]EAL4710616.1 hypothetical protein [Campylobacter jejuni]EAL7652854.1 hypothetical protein [Campylobacter jejuni]ECZ5738800.1 hypothetical protein [Campylobacter jejuni]EID0148431.1 hypothetical protein [Campylobacter jejuni]